MLILLLAVFVARQEIILLGRGDKRSLIRFPLLVIYSACMAIDTYCFQEVPSLASISLLRDSINFVVGNGDGVWV